MKERVGRFVVDIDVDERGRVVRAESGGHVLLVDRGVQIVADHSDLIEIVKRNAIDADNRAVRFRQRGAG